MMEIDCSHGEGGGQLLRTAVAAAALTRTPVRLRGIRARRARPGLAAQHLTAVRAVAGLCGASVADAALGATEFDFYPGALRPGRYEWDVGTAGSVTLVLQAALPLAIACGGAVHMRVTGGTDVRAAPPLDYFLHVFLPLLARMGANIAATVLRRGYYPRGGGIVELDVAPAPGLRPLCLERAGMLQAVTAHGHVAGLPRHIIDRMCAAAASRLPETALRVDGQVLGPDQAIARGGGLTLVARTADTWLGAAVTAERGVPAEQLGAQAGRELHAELAAGATLDVHAADQLLIYMALACGSSRFRVRELSSHAATALWLLEKLLPMRYRVKQHGTLIGVELDSSWRQ
ncbi:MAG: RNA 3'-terminal phosphate cyclase [Gammaproteobacteria bacterium]|jgi:RNA 3'-phosphate cyclase